MKQSLTEIYAVDEFGVDDERAPRVYELPPRNHFRETDDDLQRESLYARVLPLLSTPLQRRVAAMMILDHEPITMPEFKDLGIDRKTLTAVKQQVLAAISATER